VARTRNAGDEGPTLVGRTAELEAVRSVLRAAAGGEGEAPTLKALAQASALGIPVAFTFPLTRETAGHR
jgi:hypothetical protein